MKIGELSTAASTPIETIRYYEREGLLPAPARTQGNFRLYEGSHLERLQFIRYCRSLDMSLEEVRVLLKGQGRAWGRLRRREHFARRAHRARLPANQGTACAREAAEGAASAVRRHSRR